MSSAAWAGSEARAGFCWSRSATGVRLPEVQSRRCSANAASSKSWSVPLASSARKGGLPSFPERGPASSGMTQFLVPPSVCVKAQQRVGQVFNLPRGRREVENLPHCIAAESRTIPIWLGQERSDCPVEPHPQSIRLAPDLRRNLSPSESLSLQIKQQATLLVEPRPDSFGEFLVFKLLSYARLPADRFPVAGQAACVPAFLA